MKKLIRKKHKIVSLLVAALIFGNGIGTLAQENTDTALIYNEQAYEAASVLTKALVGKDVFDGEPQELVTRGAFVSAVADIFDVEAYGSSEKVYEDVDVDNEYFEAINSAYTMGWISSGENFYPQKEIIYPEALKIMFHAAHYEVFVNTYGDYPSGYLKLASEINISDNVNIREDQTISVADAQIMLYNMLHAEASDISEYKGNRPVHALGEKTNLEHLYDVLYLEGVVTSTGCNSLVFEDEINKNETRISIDGEMYLSEWLDDKLLGKAVRAYYYDDKSKTNRLCCVTEKYSKNEEKTISVDDFDGIDSSYLYYYENGKNRKTLNLDDAYKVVYNGRRVSKFEDYMLENNAKFIRLLSNDGDGEYEIIFIDGYTYGYVTGIDNFDGEIGIKFPGETVYLNASDENTVKKIYNAQGNEIELFELTNNVVVGVKKSDDNRLFEIRVCQDTAYGKVVSVDMENKLINMSKREYVDNRELDARYEEKTTTYEMSNEFVNQYLKKIKAGDELSAVLGLHGEVVYLSSGVYSMEYGYLQKIFLSNDNGDDEYYFKILEMNGEFEKYKLSKKVTVDGTTMTCADAYSVINRDFSPQVIKYSYNSKAELNVIDLASIDTSEFGKQPENSKNSLVKFYSKNDTTLRYRTGCRGFSSVGLLMNAQILFVPNNTELLDDSKNYSIGDYNTMVSDHTYSVDLFNVDEYGMVEFAAVYIDAKTPPRANSLQSGIISKLYTSYNDELGEVGRGIVVRYNNLFETYFIPDDVIIEKTSGNELCVGDIVRVYEENGIVKNVFVDYDFSSGEPVFEELSSAQELETGNASLVFVKGKLFSQGASSYVLSNTTSDGDVYDYSYGNLRPYYATGNIILFDTQTNDIRNISKSELKTYQGYEDDCDYVIIRQNYTSPSIMFVIR